VSVRDSYWGHFCLGFNGDGDALVGALIRGRYKLLLGPANKGPGRDDGA